MGENNTYLKSKNIELQFNKWEVSLKSHEIISQTRSSFYSILLLLEKEKIQRKLIEVARIQASHADLEFNTGRISEIDHYEIQFKEKQIQIDFERLNREKRTAYEFKYYFLGLCDWDIVFDDVLYRNSS